MEIDNNVSFKRKINTIGGSSVVSIPKELMEFLGVPDGVSVRLMSNVGKYGKYITLWVDKNIKKDD